MTLIYKLLTRADWEKAEAEGVLRGSEADLRDGFIHFSGGAQIAQTARVHFAGVEDLVLLEVEAEPFGEALRWEPSRNGDLFPHLYAPLPLGAVIHVRDFGADAGS